MPSSPWRFEIAHPTLAIDDHHRLTLRFLRNFDLQLRGREHGPTILVGVLGAQARDRASPTTSPPRVCAFGSVSSTSFAVPSTLVVFLRMLQHHDAQAASAPARRDRRCRSGAASCSADTTGGFSDIAVPRVSRDSTARFRRAGACRYVTGLPHSRSFEPLRQSNVGTDRRQRMLRRPLSAEHRRRIRVLPSTVLRRHRVRRPPVCGRARRGASRLPPEPAHRERSIRRVGRRHRRRRSAD